MFLFKWPPPKKNFSLFFYLKKKGMAVTASVAEYVCMNIDVGAISMAGGGTSSSSSRLSAKQSDVGPLV